MKWFSLPVIAVSLAIVAASLASIWFYPSVKDFMEANTLWNGMREFGDRYGAAGIDSTSEIPDAGENTVLLTIPYLPYSDADLARLGGFIEQGGTLLLMDDYGFGNSILVYFGVEARFSGYTLLDPLFCYKNEAMPRITDLSDNVTSAGARKLVFNHGTVLYNVKGGEVLARSSPASFLDEDGNGVRGADDPGGPFPVAATFRLGRGTVVAVADPSLVINSMVNRDDNRLFLEYLLSPGGGTRTVLLDRSHLARTTLDESKARLARLRSALASSYGQLGMLAAAVALVSMYALKRGG